MSTTSDITDTVQDQVIDTVKQVQGFVLDTIRSVAETVQPLIPDLPDLPQDLPTPAEAVEVGFGFARKILELQHDFVRDVVAATTPTGPDASAAASTRAAAK